ncbi:MHYT domain-containing protein [Desertibaculum subflavum]|uniref:MHYT domain-containing protein n=1 Tax=Desertibaculum subflavum TaxID=2268458 RepID=UPI000E66A8EF
MLKVVSCVVDEHDLRLVVLAGLICLFASHTAFGLLSRARLAERGQWLWISGAATVTGSGVWATHFVAMLAFKPGVPVGYEIERTLLSIVVAILISWIGFAAAVLWDRRAAFGGAVVGLAVAAMHFTGMSAVDVPGRIVYDGAYVAAAIVLSVVLGFAAFRISARGHDLKSRLLAASTLTLAICALHFTAMAAASIEVDLIELFPTPIAQPLWLAVAIAAMTLLIAGLGLGGTVVDQHLTDRAVKEADRLRAHVAELEATKLELEKTASNLSEALGAAAAASQAKSQFLATMSHELRTPLNAIIGFSETIHTEAFGPIGNPRYQEYIKDIHDSGVHLLAVINDILDFAKLDAGHMDFQIEPLDPRSVVRDALRFVRSQASDGGLTLQEEVAANVAHFLGDARRIRQVLLNLLANAVKFTPPGGTIRVVAERRQNRVAIVVTDTGIGMSPEQIPIALERFGQIDSTLGRKYEGSGLGLPLTKKLVEQQSGRFSIQSTLGTGTSVTFEMPVAEMPALQGEIAA